MGGLQGDGRVDGQSEGVSLDGALRVALVAGGGDDNLVVAGSGGSPGDGVVVESQSIGKSRGGDGRVAIGDANICNIIAGAHALDQIGRGESD